MTNKFICTNMTNFDTANHTTEIHLTASDENDEIVFQLHSVIKHGIYNGGINNEPRIKFESQEKKEEFNKQCEIWFEKYATSSNICMFFHSKDGILYKSTENNFTFLTGFKDMNSFDCGI